MQDKCLKVGVLCVACNMVVRECALVEIIHRNGSPICVLRSLKFLQHSASRFSRSTKVDMGSSNTNFFLCVSHISILS